MHTFVTLLNFTDQGIQNLKDSPHRADMFLEAVSYTHLTLPTKA